MPCNIGYKTYQEIYIPIPQPKPKRLRKKIEAPKADVDLLSKLGETDEKFIEWFKELDSNSLLNFALSETLAKQKTDGIDFSIEDSSVVVETEYLNSSEKSLAEKTISKVMNEFQMRVLKIIAELLDFETTIHEEAGKIIIEGEKANLDNNQVTRYLKIERGANGQSEIMFEHYSSKAALEEERTKFTVLAQKFGLPMNFTGVKIIGNPIPGGAEHKGHLSH